MTINGLNVSTTDSLSTTRKLDVSQYKGKPKGEMIFVDKSPLPPKEIKFTEAELKTFLDTGKITQDQYNKLSQYLKEQ